MTEVGLSNNDFRRLLAQPRAPTQSDQKKSGKGGKDVSAKKMRRKRPPPEKKSEETALVGDGYRDRALERRNNANPDYMDVDSQLAETHPIGFRAVAPPGQLQLHADAVTVEQSKFLGGDVAHTHLVRGLDYALLAKVRSEIQHQTDDQKRSSKAHNSNNNTDAKTSSASGSGGASVSTANNNNTAAGAKSAAIPNKTEKTADDSGPSSVLVRTALAKSVVRVLLETTEHNGSRPVTEQFLPGRMAFLFDLDSHFAQEIPTTILRSKDDCADTLNTYPARVNEAIMGKVGKIMKYVREGSSKHMRRKRKLEAAEASRLAMLENPSAPVVVTSEIDLFPDLPDNAMDVDPPASDAKNKSRSTTKSYFETSTALPKPSSDYQTVAEAAAANAVHDAIERGELPPGMAPAAAGTTVNAAMMWELYAQQQAALVAQAQAMLLAGQMGPPTTTKPDNVALNVDEPAFTEQQLKERGMQSVFKSDITALRSRRENDKRERDPNFISESYSECYPGYMEVGDHDLDEVDLSKMDQGRTGKRLRRWDFDTEEEWGKYNDQREALPKAAFQFGVKMSDGRKTRRTKKDKEKADFANVTNLLKNRYGQAVLPSKKQKKE